jgi:hypothetical protein
MTKKDEEYKVPLADYIFDSVGFFSYIALFIIIIFGFIKLQILTDNREQLPSDTKLSNCVYKNDLNHIGE